MPWRRRGRGGSLPFSFGRGAGFVKKLVRARAEIQRHCRDCVHSCERGRTHRGPAPAQGAGPRRLYVRPCSPGASSVPALHGKRGSRRRSRPPWVHLVRRKRRPKSCKWAGVRAAAAFPGRLSRRGRNRARGVMPPSGRFRTSIPPFPVRQPPMDHHIVRRFSVCFGFIVCCGVELWIARNSAVDALLCSGMH